MAKSYPNSGILSRNNDRKNDKQPEFRGSCEVDGQRYWLSAWVKENDKGKFFSLSFTKIEDRGEESQASSVDDDDVPF